MQRTRGTGAYGWQTSGPVRASSASRGRPLSGSNTRQAAAASSFARHHSGTQRQPVSTYTQSYGFSRHQYNHSGGSSGGGGGGGGGGADARRSGGGSATSTAKAGSRSSGRPSSGKASNRRWGTRGYDHRLESSNGYRRSRSTGRMSRPGTAGASGSRKSSGSSSGWQVGTGSSTGTRSRPRSATPSGHSRSNRRPASASSSSSKAASAAMLGVGAGLAAAIGIRQAREGDPPASSSSSAAAAAAAAAASGSSSGGKKGSNAIAWGSTSGSRTITARSTVSRDQIAQAQAAAAAAAAEVYRSGTSSRPTSASRSRSSRPMSASRRKHSTGSGAQSTGNAASVSASSRPASAKPHSSGPSTAKATGTSRPSSAAPTAGSKSTGGGATSASSSAATGGGGGGTATAASTTAGAGTSAGAADPKASLSSASDASETATAVGATADESTSSLAKRASRTMPSSPSTNMQTVSSVTATSAAVDADKSQGKSTEEILRQLQREREYQQRQRLKAYVATPDFEGKSNTDFYGFGKVLGQGSFGKVRLAWHRLAGAKVAIKSYEKSKLKEPNHWRRVQQEISLMERMNHPHVARMLEMIDSPKRIHIVMEYAGGGNLCSYVKQRRRLPEAEARTIFIQVLSGLEYMHDNGIIHRDVKLENILFGNGEQRDMKLVDFGFSVLCRDPNKRLKIFCGTPSYMAPEIVMRREYLGRPVDVWSLGVLLYAMLCGCFPFVAKTYPDLYKKIAQGQLYFPDYLSNASKDLIRRMLHPDPMQRVTLARIRRHPWAAPATAALMRSLSEVYDHALLIADDPKDDLYEAALKKCGDLGLRRDLVTDGVIGRKRNTYSCVYYLVIHRYGRKRLVAASNTLKEREAAAAAAAAKS